MNDRDMLLSAILESPDDDSPRLILADWLEENGYAARAEFIRVQIEIANGFDESNLHKLQRHRDGAACGCRKCKLYIRQRELLDQNEGVWTESLPESITTKECPACEGQAVDWETGCVECRRCDSTGIVFDSDRFAFSRGFIAAISCTQNDWLKHGTKMVSEHPIESVCLTDRNPRTDGFGEIGNGWWWSNDDVVSGVPDLEPLERWDWLVPTEIYRLLAEFSRGDRTNKYFRNEPTARDSLSAACVAWAKSKAKNPHIKASSFADSVSE